MLSSGKRNDVKKNSLTFLTDWKKIHQKKINKIVDEYQSSFDLIGTFSLDSGSIGFVEVDNLFGVLLLLLLITFFLCSYLLVVRLEISCPIDFSEFGVQFIVKGKIPECIDEDKFLYYLRVSWVKDDSIWEINHDHQQDRQ